MKSLHWMVALVAIGCAGAQKPAVVNPVNPPQAASACDARQLAILHDGDQRAAPYNAAAHRAKNFPDGKVAWLMKEANYQSYVVKTGAKKWGRCDDTGCYVFAAPAAVIHDAVERSMAGGHHDPAALGKALGLPAANFEGPLRIMVFDVNQTPACVRLPVDSDPGVWKCQTAADTDCFKFGGYTSGGVPEIMVIDALVEKTVIDEIQ